MAELTLNDLFAFLEHHELLRREGAMAGAAIFGVDEGHAGLQTIAEAFVTAIDGHADLGDELITAARDALAKLLHLVDACLAGLLFGLEGRAGFLKLRSALFEDRFFLRDRLFKELELILMLF